MPNDERIAQDSTESGHAIPAVAALVGGIGAIALGIGAANDTGWLAVTGGILAGVGIIGAGFAEHIFVDYGFYKRLDRLDGGDRD